jgi:hypothetical protein
LSSAHADERAFNPMHQSAGVLHGHPCATWVVARSVDAGRPAFLYSGLLRGRS